MLNAIQEEYAERTEMVDIKPYDIDKLKETFKINLNQLSRISNEISTIKKKMLSKKSEQDLNNQDIIELEKLLSINKKNYKDVELQCVHCNSRLTLEQSLTRLKLNNNLFEIQNMINLNKKQNEKLQLEIEKLQEEITDLNLKYDLLIKKKKEIQDILSLQEYIDLESKRLANEEFLKNIDRLNSEKNKLQNLIKRIKKEISNLKRDQANRKTLISNRYNEILRDINLRFGSTKLSEIKYFDFREVKGSGMDNNKTLLALYLTYMRLVSEFGVYKLPFGIDSFVKNEIDNDTVQVTFKEVEKYIFSSSNQTFFATISENLKYLSNLDKYNVIKLSKPILIKEKYSKLLPLVSKIN